MNETVSEWIEKAQGDYQTAHRELLVTDKPNFDAVCFHAQQCIEKLVKALLIQLGDRPPRTHDLQRLDQMLRGHLPKLKIAKGDLRFLSRAAIAFRYPGESADQEDASESMEICTRLRQSLLNCFPQER